MAVAKKTIIRARAYLARWGDVIGQIGGPYPASAAALMVIRESGGRKPQTIIRQAGFWEVGETLRTVAYTNGRGTAYEQNIDPLDRVSSLFGMQADYFDTLGAWREWLVENGFDIPDDDEPDACLALMHAPYSVGWKEAKALLLAGRPHCVTSAGSFPAPLEALRACLDLDDQHLPDIGPQTDDTIRLRIRRLLDLFADSDQVEPTPARLPLHIPPARIAQVRPFPPWLGAGGLRARLRALEAAQRKDG